MKIVSKQSFLSMPIGTVFSYYEPCVFTGLMVKGESLKGYEGKVVDFYYADLIGAVPGDLDKQCDVMEKGGSVEIDCTIEGREALYDETVQYAVYEEIDILHIVRSLEHGLSD